jgi:hypothetical protein
MRKSQFLVLLGFVFILLLAWAPWLNDEEIYDKVFQDKAHIDGTLGWVTYPNGTSRYTQICDYQVRWLPFGRWVASCEGGYYVTFWNQIIP